MSAALSHATPGTCFKFTVTNVHEAAEVIRERLGDQARVLSVRSVEPAGLRGLWASPKLEVIAQLVPPAPEVAAGGGTLLGASEEIASPLVSGPVVISPPEKPVLRVAPRAPERDFAQLLRRSGFSETMVARLEASPAWPTLQELPLHRGLVETGRYLRRWAGARRESAPLTRAAFIGASGCGRTTALCKWLATEVFRRARMGHVVTAEFDRARSPGPLPVFCEAMGVPVAHFPASTQPATAGGFVYFDLPGFSLRDSWANAPIAEFLAREKIEQRVLVLNAAYDHGALRAGYAAGRALGATHVVFTHLDEVTQWGRLWEYLLDGGLEPLFLATGPSLTADCEEDVFEALIRRTLPVNPETADAPAGAAESEDDADEDAPAHPISSTAGRAA